MVLQLHRFVMYWPGWQTVKHGWQCSVYVDTRLNASSPRPLQKLQLLMYWRYVHPQHRPHENVLFTVYGALFAGHMADLYVPGVSPQL